MLILGTEVLGCETELLGRENEFLTCEPSLLGCDTKLLGRKTELLGYETELLGCAAAIAACIIESNSSCTSHLGPVGWCGVFVTVPLQPIPQHAATPATVAPNPCAQTSSKDLHISLGHESHSGLTLPPSSQ